MSNELRIYWIDKINGIANSMGYASHQSSIQKAMIENGVVLDESAEIALHIKPMIHFDKIPNKINLVYSMWEFETLPAVHVAALRSGVDGLIVPCKHNKNLYVKYTDGKIPIAICPEGVDPNKFTYIQRCFPTNKKFRFLYFSAQNPRKGFFNAIMGFDKFMQAYPHLKDKVELYVKVINGKEEKIFHEDNIYLDNRTITIDELVDIYHQSECFLFPHLGEGWGLGGSEAASTGLPVIYTNYSGPCEYLDETVAYPLDYMLTEVLTEEQRLDWNFKLLHATQGAYATMQSIVDNMYEVYTNYDKALEKGKRAAERMRNEFTWDHSAKKLIKLIKDFMEVKVNENS